MTKESYIRLTQPFREHKKLALALLMVNKAVTYLMPCLYVLLIAYYIMNKNVALERTLIVPLDGFIILSVVRFLINRPRPYEKFGIPPVIKKDTKGKSWPSRHVFSAVIIGMTYLLWSPFVYAGVFILVAAVFLMIVRVLSGVHYVSDVLAGYAIGVLAGIIGFVWI